MGTRNLFVTRAAAPIQTGCLGAGDSYLKDRNGRVLKFPLGTASRGVKIDSWLSHSPHCGSSI
jgi:hypothetical protein